MITLYDYPRSSACFRVRIALELKGISYDKNFIDLMRDGGAQHGADYSEINPQQLVPAMVIDNQLLTQSMAILEYLEECFPEIPLLPADKCERARVRAFCNVITCDIHPLNNLRVQQYITGPLQLSENIKLQWYHHWLHQGFVALEIAAAHSSGQFCFGDNITLAEVTLIPQIYNAFRFSCDMKDYPHLVRIYEKCILLDAFSAASP